MSALEFLDYLHRHDVSRDLAWEMLHALRARPERPAVATGGRR
jgi:hypothetical protein